MTFDYTDVETNEADIASKTNAADTMIRPCRGLATRVHRSPNIIRIIRIARDRG